MAENNKINLLFIPYTFSNGGGAEKILQILVNNLSPEKYNISIQEVEQFDKFLKLNENVKLHLAFFNQKLPFSSFSDLNFILLNHFPSILKNVFRMNNNDVVITFNYQLPSFMLPSFINEKKVAWFHGDLYDLQDKSKKWEKQKQYQVWKYADKIVSISNKSFQSLKDLFPEFISKTKIIHNGIDISNIKKLSEETVSFSNTDEPVIVCAGRLDENKNFSLAIKAISELQKQNLNCRLIIIGEGEQKGLLENLAKELGVSDKIIFAGYQSNPYKYISKAKLLCVTSISEGWPTVVMESMALEIPFVTTPVSGASDELSWNEKCGLVAGYDEKEYASAIKKLLTDKDLYSQMSSNCMEHVKEYSAEQYVKNFEQLLEEIKTEKKSESFTIVGNIFSHILYFIMYIFSFGELFYRLQIILKRIKEKRIIKVIKNIIYLAGILIILPVCLPLKCLYFPIYIRTIKSRI